MTKVPIKIKLTPVRVSKNFVKVKAEFIVKGLDITYRTIEHVLLISKKAGDCILLEGIYADCD